MLCVYISQRRHVNSRHSLGSLRSRNQGRDHNETTTQFLSTECSIVSQPQPYLKGRASHLDQAALWAFRRQGGASRIPLPWIKGWVGSQAAGCLCYTGGQQPKPWQPAPGKPEQLELTPNESRTQWEVWKTKGDFLFVHPLHSSFLAKEGTIGSNSLSSLVRVQEDREPEDLPLSGFVENAVSKISSAGEHRSPSVLRRVSFHVIRKPDPSQRCDISAVGAPRWCADPCRMCVLFVPRARILVISTQLISPGQVSCRILVVDGVSHGWFYFKQCFNYTVFGLLLLLQLLCLLHIKPSTEQSLFHSVAFAGAGTTL